MCLDFMFLTYRNKHDRGNQYISSFNSIHNKLRKSTINTTWLVSYFKFYTMSIVEKKCPNPYSFPPDVDP